MTRRLKRYVEGKAKALERTFPQLCADDLIGDSWAIYLSADNDEDAFLSIRRHFNAVKMRTIRESRRFVSLESISQSPRYAYNPEDDMITEIDLSDDLEELENPRSAWRRRKAKDRIREYFNE